MKKIIIPLFILSNIMFAQENAPLLEDEVIIHLINYNNTLVTATATRILNQGAKWYPSWLPNPYTLIEDEEFDVVTSNNISKIGEIVPRIIFDTEGDQNYDTKKTLAVSFYKLTFSNKSSYFYINTLSKDIDDVHITFDYGNDKLYWGDCTTCTNEMSNTDILYTFDTYITEGIENYWQNGLFVVPKLGQDTVLVPHIIWGPIPNFQADGYKIYWSLNTQGGPPGNFSLLAILGANTYEYTHEGLAANGNWKAYYKVKAYNSTSESGFTNTAEIGVGGFFKDKGYAYTDNNNKFTLLSNFPNPFNPVTNIKFHMPASSVANRQAGIPKTNHVTLKVFDLLGREVAILINEPKQVGEYEIEFNASKYGLTSGVYLYQLRCYDFLQTKKFILMK